MTTDNHVGYSIEVGAAKDTKMLEIHGTHAIGGVSFLPISIVGGMLVGQINYEWHLSKYAVYLNTDLGLSYAGIVYTADTQQECIDWVKAYE